MWRAAPLLLLRPASLSHNARRIFPKAPGDWKRPSKRRSRCRSEEATLDSYYSKNSRLTLSLAPLATRYNTATQFFLALVSIAGALLLPLILAVLVDMYDYVSTTSDVERLTAAKLKKMQNWHRARRTVEKHRAAQLNAKRLETVLGVLGWSPKEAGGAGKSNTYKKGESESSTDRDLHSADFSVASGKRRRKKHRKKKKKKKKKRGDDGSSTDSDDSSSSSSSSGTSSSESLPSDSDQSASASESEASAKSSSSEEARPRRKRRAGVAVAGEPAS